VGPLKWSGPSATRERQDDPKKHCSSPEPLTDSSAEDAKQVRARRTTQLSVIRGLVDAALQALPKAKLELVGDRLLIGPSCIGSLRSDLSLALRDEASRALNPPPIERADEALHLALLLIEELGDEM
jgi:hypothetical protein